MKTFAIIDTFALLHRAWHAMPPLTTKDGRMVNAAYGFTSILLKLIKEIDPDYIVAAFDLPHETFRKKEYREYKAQREAPDQDFINQISIVEDILKALNIPKLAVPGYEADDVIGCLAKQYGSKDLKIMIVSGDHDTLQLVNKYVNVFTMRKNINDTLIYNEAAVKERYELKPEQIIDMKAIAGDASDNIPGVKGIGQKGAINLLHDFGTLENIYKNIDSEKIKPRARELLQASEKEAFLSKKLATIVTDMKIKLDLESAHIENFSNDTVIELFQDLEFRSLIAKLPKSNGKLDLQPKKKRTSKKQNYQIISSGSDMKKISAELSNEKLFCFDTETTGLDPLTANILGVSISWKAKEAVYIHTRNKTQRDAFIKNFSKIFADEKIKKIGHNIKYDLAVLRTLGVEVNGISYDTLIAAYLIQPNRSLKLEDLVFSYLGEKMQNLTELVDATLGEKQAKKKELAIEAIPEADLAYYGAEDAEMTYRLYEVVQKELKKDDMEKLLEEIEVPLIPVLEHMERDGILLDTEYLKKKEKELSKDVKKLEQKIYRHAGEEFNVSSTKQLKEILFEKLDIDTKGIKKKKTGLSTAASELEKLKDRHAIIPLISEYREITKLINTYVATLPDMVNPNDKRIHTNFNQTIAATGRLSSTDPNLQNIPIRTPLGRTIRKAFIAERGSMLVSADYSQIELRLAAIISKDKKMLKSFKAGEDIHLRTAAEVNNIPLEQVTKDQRRQAKEVNFGVIYGLGSTGLAQRTGMSRNEARAFIDTYFLLYEGVKEYIDETKALAHTQGYVETLFGRKRKLPEIYSSNPMLIAQAERMAINMPLQGTAADLMKIAMIHMADVIQHKLKTTKMLLQVHDELVFEIPNKDVDTALPVIKKTMESVASYEIPLVVDVAVGKNWTDVKSVEL